MDDSRSSPSPEVVAAFSRWLDQRVRAGARLVVGYSGGRDSSALLHLAARSAARAGYAVSAVHVHHGLSPHADAWAAHCQSFAEAVGVPLTVVRIAVDRDSPDGLEGAARAARYDVFSRIDADILLLGHHRDDQGETVLFNLLRGAGMMGAAGIPAERFLQRQDRESLVIARPLLACPRGAIDAYVAACGIPCVDDESNADARFARNFIRREVMPVLASRFPAAGQRLAEFASHAATASRLLDQLAEIDGAFAQDGRGLSVARLRSLPDERMANLLRWRLNDMGAQISSSARLREAQRQIREAGDACQSQVDFGDVSIRVWGGQVFFVRAATQPVPVRLENITNGLDVPWGSGCVRIRPASAGGLRATLLEDAAELRLRSGGERLALQAGRPRRPLKACFQDAGLPPWERASAPLLWLGERLAWVGGLGMAADCLAGPGEPAIRVDWVPEG